MSNFNKIPSQFQIFSAYPSLRIRIITQISQKILFLIFSLPSFVFFAGHCLILLSGLNQVLNLHFWQAFQIFSYNTNNSCFVLIFVLGFFVFAIATLFGLWSILGITELHANYESLKIIYGLLGTSYEISILASNIKYFNQYCHRCDELNSWNLEIVTNQIRFHKNLLFLVWIFQNWISANTLTPMKFKTIYICSYTKPNPSHWLGKVLADFYKVEFRSVFQIMQVRA
ncbi:MAG: hypothetical protein C6Y22_20265 [Hapalosiphonaceae cyanobacterium JJU2]|nr:MAG: hypothetical protein C6Y22_20265 [Hapalosiphonaceae cyanobacterium JJU2]